MYNLYAGQIEPPLVLKLLEKSFPLNIPWKLMKLQLFTGRNILFLYFRVHHAWSYGGLWTFFVLHPLNSRLRVVAFKEWHQKRRIFLFVVENSVSAKGTSAETREAHRNGATKLREQGTDGIIRTKASRGTSRWNLFKFVRRSSSRCSDIFKWRPISNRYRSRNILTLVTLWDCVSVVGKILHWLINQFRKFGKIFVILNFELHGRHEKGDWDHTSWFDVNRSYQCIMLTYVHNTYNVHLTKIWNFFLINLFFFRQVPYP